MVSRLFLVLVADPFDNHFATDKGQQTKGNPMVDRLDEGTRHIADNGARQRESKLAEAQNQRHKYPVSAPHLTAERCGG